VSKNHVRTSHRTKALIGWQQQQQLNRPFAGNPIAPQIAEHKNTTQNKRFKHRNTTAICHEMSCRRQNANLQQNESLLWPHTPPIQSKQTTKNQPHQTQMLQMHDEEEEEEEKLNKPKWWPELLCTQLHKTHIRSNERKMERERQTEREREKLSERLSERLRQNNWGQVARSQATTTQPKRAPTQSRVEKCN